LRSTHDVTGHHLQATDGEIGHAVDFVIDPATWAIRYLDDSVLDRDYETKLHSYYNRPGYWVDELVAT
jgi:hypothetical protein